MKYTIKRIDNNNVVLEGNRGNRIKIIFTKEDNKEVEELVLGNLLTSYEKRIKDKF